MRRTKHLGGVDVELVCRHTRHRCDEEDEDIRVAVEKGVRADEQDR